MEYLQVRIKYAKRDDKCIIWKCRVQKGLTETCSSFSQCLCGWSFTSVKAGSPCTKPRHCCWTGASPVPSLGLPAQSHPSHELHSLTHTSCSSQNLPLLLKYPNATCSALAANIPWARLAGCSSQRWGKWAQTAQGACLAVRHSLLISCEICEREAAQ